MQLNAGFQPSFTNVSPGQFAPQKEAIPFVASIVTFPPFVVKATVPCSSTYSHLPSPTKPATPIPASRPSRG